MLIVSSHKGIFTTSVYVYYSNIDLLNTYLLPQHIFTQHIFTTLPVAKHVDRELHCSNSKYKFPNSKCKFPSAFPYGQVLWTLRDPRHPRIWGCARLQRFAESRETAIQFFVFGNFRTGAIFFRQPPNSLSVLFGFGKLPVREPQRFRARVQGAGCRV